MTQLTLSPAADSVLKFQRGEITINQLLLDCRTTLRKIAHFIADKYQRRDIRGHREEMASDLFQDLQCFLWQKIAAEFDPAKGAFESLVVTYAKNTALSKYLDKEFLLSGRGGHVVADDFFDSGGHTSDLLYDAQDSLDIELETDRKLAMQQILAFMPTQKEHNNQPKQVEFDDKSTSHKPILNTACSRGGKHEGGPKYTLTDEQKELREIMKELRVKQPEMANSLAISNSKLASYIYGRTATVDPKVMENARGLRISGSLSVDVAKKNFDGKSMSTIMDSWQEKLGWLLLSVDDRDAKLAKFLGVATITPTRWRNNSNRPEHAALGRYQLLIDEFAKLIS